MELKTKKCVPCEGGVPKLTPEEIIKYSKQVHGWETSADRIFKHFQFKNFLEAMKFVNQMAEIAEAEGHHPDFCISYNKVEVEIWTHAVSGLSENDFILAAKIDEIK